MDREKIVLATLPELSQQIVEFARENGRITIGETIKLTGANRNTLKQHFRNLVANGQVNQSDVQLSIDIPMTAPALSNSAART